MDDYDTIQRFVELVAQNRMIEFDQAFASLELSDGIDLLQKLLYVGISNNEIEIVRAMIDRAVDLNKSDDGMPPLFVAVTEARVDIIKLLLSQSVDPDSRFINDETALHIAARQGDLECIDALCRHGANANAMTNIDFYSTPLMEAAKRGHLDAVKLLLSFGANPAVTNCRGETVLSVAAQRAKDQIRRMIAE